MNKRNVAIVSVLSGAVILGAVSNTEFKAQGLPSDPKGLSPYGSVSHFPGAYGLRARESNVTVREGKQKALVLMVEFSGANPKTFSTNPQDYYNSFFGDNADSIKSWLTNQSGGKLSIEPADTTQNGMPEGVVKVTIDPSTIVEGNVGVNDFAKQQALIEEAIKQAQSEVEWAKIDKDGNKVFVDSFHGDYTNPVNEELLITTVFAGNTVKNGNGANGPEAWPHLTQIDTEIDLGQDNRYTFSNVSIVTGETVESLPVQTSVLGHEYLHGLGARDMYKDRESIGAWSVMDRCYGNRDTGEGGGHLNPIDPIHKISWGWSDVNMIDLSDPKVTKGTVTSKDNQILGFTDPKDSNTLYFIEYRDFKGNHYEQANYRYGLRENGAIIWKMDKNKLRTDFLGTDWYLNTDGPKTSIQVLTANSNEGVTVDNTLQPVGKKFKIPGIDFTFVAEKESGKITYERGSSETPGVGEKIEIFALDRTIKVGQNFNPKEGVTATAGDGTDITEKIQVTNNTVKPNRPGKYNVTYSVTHEGFTVTKTIIVTVEEADKPAEKPTIIAPNITLKVGSKWEPMKGVSATDANGVDITEDIEIIEDTVKPNEKGNYIVVYKVVDSSGNVAIKDRMVTVVEEGEDVDQNKDTTPPVIKGANDTVIYVGDKFDALKGVSAVDDKDGIVGFRVISDNVNTKEKGTYQVVYEAVDNSGNSIRVTREVIVMVKNQDGNETVKDTTAPNISLLGNATSLVTQKGNPLKLESFIVAIDDRDGNVKETLEIEKNSINWNASGTYIVKCSAKDKSGNIANYEFVVKVEDHEMGISYREDTIKVGDTSFDPLQNVSIVSTSAGKVKLEVIEDETTLDLNKPGDYVIKYLATNEKTGATTKFTRKIKVVETDEQMIKFPDIKLPDYKIITLEEASSKDKFLASVFKDTGIDLNEYDISYSIDMHNTLGKQLVKASLTHKATGAKMNYSFVVNIVAPGYENGMPVINASDKTITIGDEFFPLHGVTAMDLEDGDLTDKIVVKENNVDTSALGSYDVVYVVTDSDRNVSKMKVTVKVVEKTEIADTDTDKNNSQKPNTDKDTNKNENKYDDLLNGVTGLDKDENKLPGGIPKTGAITSTSFMGMLVAGLSGIILRFKKK